MTAAGADLFHAWRMLKEYRTWPAPGGWLQQVAKFVEAVDFCDRALSVYQRRGREKAAEAQRMAEEAAKLMGTRR